MANMEDQFRELRDMNSELVQEVQYWKVTAAQHEKEKLDLMKEINELRLKISRLRSGGAAESRKLDTALQSCSEEALTHLVQASGAVARSMELVKQYILDRQELDMQSPRWSSLGNTPNSEKVHRVRPMLIGGQSIHPVVALNRTLLNTARSTTSPSNVTQRAVPMRMLQDVYIPLTRIDMAELQASMETEGSNNNSTEDMALDDSEDPIDESQNASSVDDFTRSRRLDAVMEDTESDEVEPNDDDDEIVTPPRPIDTRLDNPLEGPSWLLDVPNRRQNRPKTKEFLEADSTTPSTGEETATRTETEHREVEAVTPARVFTPTVRRRKRPATPPSDDSPLPPPAPSPPAPSPPATSPSDRPPRNSRGDCKPNRVLKVVVAKMRLYEEPGGGGGGGDGPPRAVTPPGEPSPPPDVSPPKRAREPAMRFDAPSPNGTTDTGVIVSENRSISEQHIKSRATSHASRTSVDSRHSRTQDNTHSDSDGEPHEGRTRRTRKNVTYKEKPLNRTQDNTHSDSDGEPREGRTRRTRKNVTYKEKPLNRTQDNTHSDSDGEPREGRTRSTRKNVTYKEKPLNRPSC